jgi:hypothetical protein
MNNEFSMLSNYQKTTSSSISYIRIKSSYFPFCNKDGLLCYSYNIIMDDYFLNKLFLHIFMYYKRKMINTDTNTDTNTNTNTDHHNSYFQNIIIIEYFFKYYYNHSYNSELKYYSLNINRDYKDINIYINLMLFSDKSIYKDLFRIFHIFYDHYLLFNNFTMNYKEFIHTLHNLSLIHYWNDDFIGNKEILSYLKSRKKEIMIRKEKLESDNRSSSSSSSCHSYLLNLFSKYNYEEDKKLLSIDEESLSSEENSLQITMSIQCNFYYIVDISTMKEKEEEEERIIKTRNNFKISIYFYLSYPYNYF